MNELYKTIFTDIWSFALFYLVFLLMSFSVSFFATIIVKTIIDYYYLKQIQYLNLLNEVMAKNRAAAFSETPPPQS